MFDDYILDTVKESIPVEGDDFDNELTTHILACLSILNQNGIGKNIVFSKTQRWSDFKDENQTKGNEHFSMVPMYVCTRTKLLFDPPPPSSVQFYDKYIDELLWRLKFAYEEN